MAWVKDTKVAVITKHAERAIQEGRVVFLARINVGMTDAGMSGPVTGAAEQIEAVEAVGWRLDQMSYAQDKGGKPEGYFLFRRAQVAQQPRPPQQGYPQQRPPQQGYPQQQGRPQQGYPQQGY